MSYKNNQNQDNRISSNQRTRNHSSNRNRNRNKNYRNYSCNRSRNKRPDKPLVLTFWQKILKSIGCLDESKLREKVKNQSPSKGSTHKSNVRNLSGKSKSAKKHGKPPQRVPVNSARLYVGNLSYDATEYDIEDLFKGVGTVKNVEIIYNRNTHKSKGYGFIQMLNKEEAERAVQVLHDQPFMSRQLVVNGSKSRRDGDKSGKIEHIESV